MVNLRHTIEQTKNKLLKKKGEIFNNYADEVTYKMQIKFNEDLIEKIEKLKKSGIPLLEDDYMRGYVFTNDLNKSSLVILLASGISPNERNTNGDTLLMKQPHNKDNAEFLLRKGVDLHAVNDLGENALFGSGETVGELLINKGINKQLINKKGENLLFNLAYGANDLFEFFVNAGVDVHVINNNKQNVLSINPLYAIYLKNEDVKTLMDYNIKNDMLHSHLYRLFNSKDESAFDFMNKSLKKMKEANVDVNYNQLDENGNNLYAVCRTKKTIEFLLKRNVSLSVLNNNNESMYNILLKNKILEDEPQLKERIELLHIKQQKQELSKTMNVDAPKKVNANRL